MLNSLHLQAIRSSLPLLRWRVALPAEERGENAKFEKWPGGVEWRGTSHKLFFSLIPITDLSGSLVRHKSSLVLPCTFLPGGLSPKEYFINVYQKPVVLFAQSRDKFMSRATCLWFSSCLKMKVEVIAIQLWTCVSWEVTDFVVLQNLLPFMKFQAVVYCKRY